MPTITQVGVGVFFECLSDGTYVVQRLIEGAPASACDRINVGDVLLEIDGSVVIGKSSKSFMKLYLGTPGTPIRLKFRKVSNELTPYTYEVVLLRGGNSAVSKSKFGVGIVLKQDPVTTMHFVSRLLEGGTAYQSGLIKEKDYVVRVGDDDIVGKLSSEVMQLIAGSPGAPLRLTLIRLSVSKEPFEILLNRCTENVARTSVDHSAIKTSRDRVLMDSESFHSKSESSSAFDNLTMTTVTSKKFKKVQIQLETSSGERTVEPITIEVGLSMSKLIQQEVVGDQLEEENRMLQIDSETPNAIPIEESQSNISSYMEEQPQKRRYRCCGF
jgi:C-terminal processing protease CtpA/Prc